MLFARSTLAFGLGRASVVLLDLPEQQVVGGVFPADHVALAGRAEVLVAVAARYHQHLGRGERGNTWAEKRIMSKGLKERLL